MDQEPPSPSGQALPPGTRLEEFEVESVLGRGGFGITYLARDTSLERQVVIKENLPTMCAYRDATSGTVRPQSEVGEDVDTYRWSMENFLREATTLASLDHPGIVPVLRKFEANGTAYFVMPYMEGLPLDELIKNRWERGEGISDDELGGLLEHVLGALAYLHASGIYHRDIKPGNILVTKEGVPILIDFGSARQRLSERSMTVVESAGYTPFEQLQSRGNVGPWSDLYSLGATVAKAIAGEAPPKAADRVYDDPWVPLVGRKDLEGHYSEELLASIDRALEPQVSPRFQEAGEWLGALQGEQFASGEEESVPLSTGPAIGPRRLKTERRESQIQERLATEQMADRIPNGPAAQGFTLAGMNLGYACPIVAIVATVIGCANQATMQMLDFPRFDYGEGEPLIGYFLYMMAFYAIPFFLAAGLPLLANLRKKARIFCIIGFAGSLDFFRPHISSYVNFFCDLTLGLGIRVLTGMNIGGSRTMSSVGSGGQYILQRESRSFVSW